MNREHLWYRQWAYLGDAWHHILIKRRRFRKNKLKAKIDNNGK